ncbi:hypothetical protein GV054_08980 [Marinomonas mediterranea]|jgi:Pyocin activator protein PrtN.|uniref:Pyocin activator protein PrtN n=1 Tax=Marinomonas mediterranea (strain ATCC 700492 / JCM 21426 / NBRC 103028 / MMB-1) TaxID=717774 RepID=F2K1D4_MARM1|nr:pyocin activator PrtN family protein [Marinomonas mediterranea]ADZ91065.1 hypothetical protein Marme_1809 [Marinomonas mediterranea MMB-1]WCN13130.1 hypothetical protein GV054_08980 [Marinomonas mediterranea]WCN17201.1 hypothetical protein GV053_09145 [Marinomonas mediterranea MMB-1]
MTSKTLFLLMAEFEGRTAVPLAEALHYTNYTTLAEANKAANAATLSIPAFRMADSQKSPYMVHLEDLAVCIDAARKKAMESSYLLSGKAPIIERASKNPPPVISNRRGRREKATVMAGQ